MGEMHLAASIDEDRAMSHGQASGCREDLANAVYHLAEDGHGRREVMDALGISVRTLARAIRTLKDQGRYHPSLDAGPYWNAERTARLVAMVQAGSTSGEMADVLCRSAAAIRSSIVVLRRLGMICPKPRRGGRAHRGVLYTQEGLS